MQTGFKSSETGSSVSRLKTLKSFFSVADGGGVD